MAIRKVLLLGNPKLYEISEPVEKHELEILHPVVQDLHDTLMDFRSKYGAGRAIAAPQIGVMKRMIYMNIDKEVILINPAIDQKSEEMMAVWDDCLCFPELLVKVLRHNSCHIRYKNNIWEENELNLEGDLSELLQHEYDHLDGILAISRAIDEKSFSMRSQKQFLT